MIVKKRKSNFELLRIISMLMIVFYHFATYGYANGIGLPLSINKLYLDFISIGGNIGVILFIMITGYFNINSKFHISKLIILYLDITIYSMILAFIYIALGYSASISYLIHSFLPIIYNVWWFVTAYFGIYCFSYFINKLIHVLSESELNILLLVLFLFNSILPNLLASNNLTTSMSYFIFIYILGAKIRLYGMFKKIQNSLIMTIVSILLIFVISVLLELLSLRLPILSDQILRFSRKESPLIILASIFLFKFIENKEIPYNKYINMISASTLGIYLIHEYYLIRFFIWGKVLYYLDFIYEPNFIYVSIIYCLMVFMTCMILSMLYNFTIGKLVRIIINKAVGKVENKKYSLNK